MFNFASAWCPRNSQSRDLLRRMLKEHVTDDTQTQLAKRVVDHLELSGFVAPAAVPERARDVVLQHGHSGQVPRTMTIEALLDEVGTPGTSAADTRASTAIALTRASLDAVARISAATEVIRV